MSRILLVLLAGVITLVAPVKANVVIVVEEAITFRNDSNRDFQVWILSEKMDAWAKANCVKLRKEHYSVLEVPRGGKHNFVIRHPGKHYVFVANAKSGVENHLGWICLRDLRCKAGAGDVSVNVRLVEKSTNGRDSHGRPIVIRETVSLPDLAVNVQGRLAFYRGDKYDFRMGRVAR